MRNALANFVCIVWALWLGGIAVLFVVMGEMFRESPETGRSAAPLVFHIFERYQLVLATAVLISTAIWRFMRKSGLLTTIFFLFALTTIGALVETRVIMPQMDRLGGVGPQFNTLHGESMVIYTAEMVLLLILGLLIPAALRQSAGVTPSQK